MKERLAHIYGFLSENRQYNRNLQEKYYKSWVCSHTEVSEKIISVLYNVANTQSQPNIDNLSQFYKFIYKNKSSLSSFESFSNLISDKDNKVNGYGALYTNLKKHKGWGKKTAALFAKNIYYMHNFEYSEDIRIWNDVPKTIIEGDSLYLPVDVVIKEIFRKVDDTEKWTFIKINKLLNENYANDEIAVWDDLWFWGFITQHGTGAGRRFGWNENKYWMLADSSKDAQTIKIIEEKANRFLLLLDKT